MRWFIVVSLVGLLMVTGCSPDVASPEFSQDNSQSDSSSGPEQQAQRELTDRLQGPPISPQTSEEDIEATLAAMEPVERTEVVLRMVSFSMLYFFSKHGRYPTNEEGIDVLMSKDESAGNIQLPELFVLDGWGRKIQYEAVTFENGLPGFRLRSLGPDGVISDDDIIPDVEKVSVEVTATIVAGGL